MILFRWAVMRFSERLPAVAPWSTRTEGNVDVAVAHVRNSDSHAAPTSLSFLAPRQMPELEPTEVVILASTEIGVRTRGPFQIEIDDAPRRRAERAISTFAANLGIVAETSWTLSSPNPFLAVAASSEEDRETLHLAERIVLPPRQLAPAFLGTGLGVATDLLHLTDRLDGVRLLGAAVSTTTGVARLHELFRLLENAFACAGERLVTPLERFLKSYPAWDLGIFFQRDPGLGHRPTQSGYPRRSSAKQTCRLRLRRACTLTPHYSSGLRCAVEQDILAQQQQRSNHALDLQISRQP